MIILQTVILVTMVINLFVSIAVAGTVMRLVKALELEVNERPRRGLVDLQDQPTYADRARFSYGNYDGFNPQEPNWDGIPQK
jgi:hypothetical protein